MATEKEIEAAKALLESEGFAIRVPSDQDWKKMGAVVSCNIISDGLTEKRFVQMIESALSVLFANRASLSRALQYPVSQMGPLRVKSYTRVQVGLRRRGQEIGHDDNE